MQFTMKSKTTRLLNWFWSILHKKQAYFLTDLRPRRRFHSMSVTRTDISTHSRKERSFSVKPTSSNLGWRSMTPKISEGAGVGGVGSAAQVTGAPRGSNTPKSVKLLLLVVLCLQNAVYTMLRRYRYTVLEWITGWPFKSHFYFKSGYAFVYNT